MPSKDNLYNGRKGIGFENLSYFEKAKDLRPMLYDERVIGLGYTPMFLTHSDEALEIEKFKRSRENKIKFAYDYGNLNASYQTSSLKPYLPNVILETIIIDLEDEVVNLLEKEKVNMETIESLKSKSFESSEKIVQICLWIIDSGCSKHMTGIRALLTNFVEKFLGTVRFGNNDFAVIA
nr:integrase, catalytic region, zinc finger, CCHC-type, peptidase aspartic, catalytic [Tanacetum cinerariifolium]